MKTIRNVTLAALAGIVLGAGTAAVAQDAKPEVKQQPKAEQRDEGKHGRHGAAGAAGAGCAGEEREAHGHHRGGRMGHRHGGGHDHSQS